MHELGGFRVPVSVRRSNVAGRGVFLDVSLPEGALVWEFNQTVGYEEKQLRRRSLRMPWFDEDLRTSTQKGAAPRMVRRRSAVFTVPMPPPGAAGPARTPENAAGVMLALQ